MRIVITCGPSWEPIDDVRRITNFSTGELGLTLADEARKAGHEVDCFVGEYATHSLRPDGVKIHQFRTNDDLVRKLENLPDRGSIDAVFHAAALCDFRVQPTVNAAGQPQRKIASRAGTLQLTLVPATKLLPLLPSIFPGARIVGWKYELDGSQEDAVAKGRAQLASCGTAACAVNGAAYGIGFGFLEPGKDLLHIPNRSTLYRHLVDWL